MIEHKTEKRSAEELKAVRQAQKRVTWIDNVKRIKGWTQEQAEAEWTKIFYSVNEETK